MDLAGVARQFHLQLGFEGPVCLPVTGEFVGGGNVLGSAAAGGARVGHVEREVQAACEPLVLRLLLDKSGFLLSQLGFKPGDLGSDQMYCIGRSSACFEDFEEVLVAEYGGEVPDLGLGKWSHSLAIPCGDGLDKVESALVKAH